MSPIEPRPLAPTPQPGAPVTLLQPLDPLQRDQVRDPSVFFDGAVFSGVPRLSIPLHPIVYVTPQVEASQAAREHTDSMYYSNPAAVQHGTIQSSSIGAGLGLDSTLFVQLQVRRSQTFGELTGDIVEGRLPRISLSSDGRIATPEWFQPDAEQIVPSASSQGQPQAQQLPTQVAERPDILDLVTVRPAETPSGSVAAVPVARAAAPSFSEQLRSAGARAPVAVRSANTALVAS